MAKEDTTAVRLPTPPLPKNVSPFSSSFRFLRFADHPKSVPSAGSYYELDEADVFWSPDLYYEKSSAGGDSPSSTLSDGLPRAFFQEKFGLSAAIENDRVPSVQQRLAVEVSKVFHKSAPVNVPEGRLSPVEPLVEEEELGEEMLPPHVILARSHVMTFSVFEGVGRTLKGRDLRRVRNAVFQKTGFLD